MRGLSAKETAEFDELQRVGCHVALPACLQVWLVMQPCRQELSPGSPLL
jgi:hypothetical protein